MRVNQLSRGGRPVQAEDALHRFTCDYLRLQYPHAIFRTDFAAGLKLTMWQSAKHKRMQSSRAYPDLFIAEPRAGWCGMFLELKREGTRIFLKNGQLTADAHIREQAAMLNQLHERGYFARFAVGLDNAKMYIDQYMRGERDRRHVAQCTFYDLEPLATDESTKKPPVTDKAAVPTILIEL